MKRTTTITVDALVTARLERAGARSLPKETGGILVGHYEKTGRDLAMTVSHCIEVPDPHATSSGFTLDPVAADQLLQDYRSRHDPTEPLYYVGDWHTHPSRQGASPRDHQILCQLATGKRLPMAIIVLSWDGTSWLCETHVSRGHPWWRLFI